MFLAAGEEAGRLAVKDLKKTKGQKTKNRSNESPDILNY